MKDIKDIESTRFVGNIPGDGDMTQSLTNLFSVRSPFISVVFNSVSKWKWRGTSGKKVFIKTIFSEHHSYRFSKTAFFLWLAQSLRKISKG